MPRIEIPFHMGLDESVNENLVDAGKGFTVLTNARQVQSGGITKSRGWSALTASKMDSSSMTANYRIAAHKDQVLSLDASKAQTYSETAARWSEHNRYMTAKVSEYVFPSFPTEPITHEAVYCNGYLVHVAGIATVDSGGVDRRYIWATIMDATTGAVLRHERISTVTTTDDIYAHVRLVVFDTVVQVYYRSAANTISAKSINVGSASGINTGWSGASSMATDASFASASSYGFDVAGVVNGSHVLLAYANNSGGASRLTLARVTQALAVASTATVNTNNRDPDIACDTDASYWYVAWFQPADSIVKINQFNSGLSAGTAYQESTGIIVVGKPEVKCIDANGTGYLLFNNRDTGYAVTGWKFSTAATVITQVANSGGVVRNCQIAGSPIYHGSRLLIPFAPAYNGGVNSDQQLIVADVTDVMDGGEESAGSATAVMGYAHPVANIRHRLSRPPGVSRSPTRTHAPRTFSISTGVYCVANVVARVGTVAQTSAATIGACTIHRLDFTSPQLYTNCPTLGGSIVLAGSVANVFDGDKVAELGFIQRPASVSATRAGAATYTVTTGCNVVATYEWVDANGVVWMSEPSDPVTLSAGTYTTINYSATALSFTRKAAGLEVDTANSKMPLKCVWWATADNGGTGVYYQQASGDFDSFNGASGFGGQLTTSSRQLYTTPGQIGAALVRQAPPAMSAVCSHGDRVVGIDDSGSGIVFSGPAVEGEGPWFNALQRIPVNGFGLLTSIWSQNGRLIVSSETEIAAIDGEGPPENGGNGTEFSLPRGISDGIGCINQRSVVQTPVGVMFQSRRGIELLANDYSVQWIGAKVQTTLASYPNITGAIYVPADRRVLFTCASTETGQLPSGLGTILSYDLATSAWSIDTGPSATAGIISSACLATYGGVPIEHYAQGNGVVVRRRAESDASAYLDASSWRTMIAQTGWIRFGGISTNAIIRKVQLMATRHTDHTLTVSVGFNGRSSFEQVQSFSRATLAAETVDGEHIEIDVGNERKCHSIRVKIQDDTPSGGTVGSGRGATWWALVIDYELLDEKPARRPAGLR